MTAEIPGRLANGRRPGSTPPPMPGGGRPPARAGARPERVLIVEDNWLVAVEAEAALTGAGYLVVGIATSAAEAVSTAGSGRPDFVLMDIRLRGGSDGVDAAVEIARRFGIRSIFVSAHDDGDTRARARAAAPLGWIPKPVSGPRLVVEVARLRRPRQ